jgi:hypothetical protein
MKFRPDLLKQAHENDRLRNQVVAETAKGEKDETLKKALAHQLEEAKRMELFIAVLWRVDPTGA